MKLMRLGEPGREKPAVLIDGVVYGLHAVVNDIDGDFWSSNRLDDVRSAIEDRSRLPVMGMASLRIGAPVARPGSLVCVGLNYADHARESGAEPPPEPVLFLKATSTVVGPYDDVRKPRGSTKLDWEVELGLVIGKRARYLTSDEEAIRCIGGYLVSHDVSERAFQFERGGQWTKGKSCETFNPLGPWLVTPEELVAPDRLELTTTVNGTRVQRGTAADLIFDIPFVVRYISQFITLEPGDVITTGTPAGVGHGMSPPRYLQVGDTVELSVTGLGTQRQRIVDWDGREAPGQPADRSPV